MVHQLHTVFVHVIWCRWLKSQIVTVQVIVQRKGVYQIFKKFGTSCACRDLTNNFLLPCCKIEVTRVLYLHVYNGKYTQRWLSTPASPSSFTVLTIRAGAGPRHEVGDSWAPRQSRPNPTASFAWLFQTRVLRTDELPTES